MAKPIVSIITPLFNSVNFFEETYQSVISQTFQDWEWIIVDDCSTDGSFELATKLVENDSRITIFKNSENKGSSASRNVALKNASGKYVTFLDSDDLLDSNYLEKQVNYIKDNGPIITGSYRRNAKHSSTTYSVPKKISFHKLVGGNAMSCLTTMYDREVFPNELFDETIEKQEDYVFWLKMLQKGYHCNGNPEVLATYRIHDGSKNTKKAGLVKYNYFIYHKVLGFNTIHSSFCILRWAIYGVIKNINIR